MLKIVLGRWLPSIIYAREGKEGKMEELNKDFVSMKGNLGIEKIEGKSRL